MVLFVEAFACFTVFSLSAFFTKTAVERCCIRSPLEGDGGEGTATAVELQPLGRPRISRETSCWNLLHGRTRYDSISNSAFSIFYGSLDSTENKSTELHGNDDDYKYVGDGYEADSETSTILERGGNRFDDSDEAFYDRQIRHEAFFNARRSFHSQTK